MLCRSSFNGEKSSGRWVRKSPAHRLWYVLLPIRSRMSWAESGLNIAASSRLPTTLTCKRVGGVEALGASSGPVQLYSTRLKKVMRFSSCTVKRPGRSNMSDPRFPPPPQLLGFYPPAVRGAQSHRCRRRGGCCTGFAVVPQNKNPVCNYWIRSKVQDINLKSAR